MPLTQTEHGRIINLIKRNPHVEHKKGWGNFSRNIHLPDALVLKVGNVASLQEMMTEIFDLNNRKEISDRIIVRVAAGGRGDKYSQSYSFTAGSEADIVLQLTGDEFRQIRVVDKDNCVVSIGASVQIGEADQKLYDTFNMVMPTSSLIPYVTIAGLSANAGHGAGKDQPGFAGLIRAMTLCLPNGKIVRIDHTHPDFETIRGAHLGLFGVVIDVELQCAPARKLQCVIEKRSLPEFLEDVRNGLFQENYAVSVMYVPTYYKNELVNKSVKNVIVYRYKPVDKAAIDSNHKPAIDRWSQDIQIAAQEIFDIDDLLCAAPSLIPYYMRYLLTRSAIGFEDQIEVGPWPLFHYQTAFPRKMNDISYVFTVDDAANNDKIIAAYTKFCLLLGEHAKRGEYPVAYATYGRYFEGTNGGLSISAHQAGEHVFGFDVVSLPGLQGFNKFRQSMSSYLQGDLQGKPHWGKYVPEGVDYTAMYGEAYPAFMEALHKWYRDNSLPLDHSPFLNDFICRILNLPELSPSLPLRRTVSQDDDAPLIPVSDLAKAAASCVLGDDDDACQLRKQLQALVVEDRLSHSSSSLFGKKDNAAEPGVQDKVKERGCCVLM